VPKDHARLSPSAIRWLHCPASPDVEAALPPNASGGAARAGGDLHAHLELALRLDVQTADWLLEPQRQQVDLVLDVIRGLRRIEPDARLYVEERLGPPQWRPQNDLWGTADAVLLSPQLLAVIDAKFGRHPVPATSPQLQIYLSLAVERFGPRPLMLTMILQPGLSQPIRIAAWPADMVDTFTQTMQRAAAATDDPAAARHANNWCWFCRARPTCPEIILLETQKARDELSLALMQ
jgi:hypothetical protein